MKKVAIAIASVFALAAPAAFAQTYWSAPQDPQYQSRDQNRDYRDSRDSRDSRDNRDNRGFRERDGDSRRDFARVIETRPIHAVSTRQECWNPRAGVYEEVRDENRTRVGKGAAIGAVAGGVLGHQVDQGGGTAVGAILGGLLGHHLERRNDSNEQTDLDFARCRVLGDAGNSNAEGYEVRYEYDGRQYVTHLNQDPGQRVRLGEEVRRDGTPFDNVTYRNR